VYDAVAVRDSSRPELLVVITGKGPLKEKFVELMDLMPWKNVQVLTPWLEADDYPLMLGERTNPTFPVSLPL
jgi:beta-1,4-mannosyltransferase